MKKSRVEKIVIAVLAVLVIVTSLYSAPVDVDSMKEEAGDLIESAKMIAMVTCAVFVAIAEIIMEVGENGSLSAAG